MSDLPTPAMPCPPGETRPFSAPPEPYAAMSLEEARAVLPPGPRVGIVHDWLNGMRGGEKVLEELLALFPGAPIYTLFYETDRVSEAIRAHPVRASLLNRLPGVARYYRHLLPLMPAVMSTPKFRDIDLLVSTSHCVAKGAIAPARRSPPVPHVCYCHAPMRYVWDQFDDYFGPGRASLPARTAMRALRPPLRRWDVRASDRVTHFLCNSRHIAEKIGRFYGREAHVVPPPVDAARFAAGPPQREREYWLVVSALVPYKRVDLAVRAAAGRGERLVVAGRGPERAKLEALAAALGADVEFRGWTSDEELPGLYAGARGLLFPGEEDFGITPLEAMAAATPVVALGRGGALETVVEGETGFFFRAEAAEGGGVGAGALDGAVAALTEAMARAAKHPWDAAVLRARAAAFDRPAFRLNLARHLAWLAAK